MNERRLTDKTAPLQDEDWCTKCKQRVDEWKVSFETTIHSYGNQKLHRCPHCDELCFADRTSPLGCFLFYFGLFLCPFLLAILGFARRSASIWD